jgi:hypothetical protein
MIQKLSDSSPNDVMDYVHNLLKVILFLQDSETYSSKLAERTAEGIWNRTFSFDVTAISGINFCQSNGFYPYPLGDAHGSFGINQIQTIQTATFGRFSTSLKDSDRATVAIRNRLT